MSVIREVYNAQSGEKEQYSVSPDHEAPTGYLHYQAEFGEHIDRLRTATRRDIPYKSMEWYTLYLSYIAGRQDAYREEREALAKAVGQ